MGQRRSPTSTDVAKRAGVSRVTVSTVLNGRHGTVRVSEATRQRVLAAVAELNYVPHPMAQALRRRQSRTIGFVPRPSRGLPMEEPVPYLLGINVAHAAIRRGYHLVEASAETTTSRRGDDLVQFLLDRRVDGVIFDCPGSESEVQRCVDHSLPVVQLMRPQFAVPTPAIIVNAADGIVDAIDHLVALGHHAIAFLGTDSPHPIDRARFDGFLTALARHGIAAPAAHLRLGVARSLIEEGYDFALALVALSARPTAIFAAGDPLALGALRALYEARVRVPDDMSLISYDDTVAPHLYPPLTSVSQPLAAVADRAIALIADAVEGWRPDGISSADPDAASAPIVLPTRLTIRDSTRAPSEGATLSREGGATMRV